METTPLSQEGSKEQELETKRGMENECLRGRMKFSLCVQRAEGAEEVNYLKHKYSERQ